MQIGNFFHDQFMLEQHRILFIVRLLVLCAQGQLKTNTQSVELAIKDDPGTNRTCFPQNRYFMWLTGKFNGHNNLVAEGIPCFYLPYHRSYVFKGSGVRTDGKTQCPPLFKRVTECLTSLCFISIMSVEHSLIANLASPDFKSKCDWLKPGHNQSHCDRET